MRPSHKSCIFIVSLSCQSVIVFGESLNDCLLRKSIKNFPDFQNCCDDKSWLIKTDSGSYSCAKKPCGDNFGNIWFEGKCLDAYGDGVCDGRLGARLYHGEDGTGYCGCQEGWLMIENNCYQEFTPALHLCPETNHILRFQPPDVEGKVHWVEDLKQLELQLTFGFSCVENFCENGYFPHWTTFDYDKEEGPCHEVLDESTECELVIDRSSNDNDTVEGLKCCTPSNRSVCDSLLTVLSVVGPHKTRKCQDGCYLNPIRDKCHPIWPQSGLRC